MCFLTCLNYIHLNKIDSLLIFLSRARRLKRLEGHVITLAKSVAQLSSEIRSNHCLMKEVETLRKDIDIIQEQFKTMKLAQVLEM